NTLGIHRWMEKSDAYGVRPLCFSVWSEWRQGRNGPATVSRIEKPRCFAGPALAPQSGRVSSL
ncbi:hypothetical protein, partial [Aneurinibacillus aneurinilyticus]|uniref:hypothetical protein n=1 Tax=Aneurinibacillus aneurinilyticus TaxID=1391 RepID=UPI0023F4A325